MPIVTALQIVERLKANDWQARYWSGSAVERVYVTSRYRGECGYIQFGPGDALQVNLTDYESLIRAAAGLPG